MNSNKQRLNGAQAIMEALVAEGVKDVFGYPGGAIIPVYDALYDYGASIRHILVRHEQGAIHAAQGYARASGRVGVVFATSGPGATNLVTGLADAMMDSTPVVCITGQVYSALLGTDAFQEADVISVTAPVTKWNYQVTNASELPEVLAKAFYLAASGRPGPVLVDVTKDAQLALFRYKGYVKHEPIQKDNSLPASINDLVRQAACLLDHAERPLLLFGQGVILANAEAELLGFIERSGLPTAATILGLSAIPSGHPLFVGMLGMHGNIAPNRLTNEADVVIAVGMRFDDRVTGRLDQYAKQARIIHVDIDPSELNKNVTADVPICGDCRYILPPLTQRVRQKQYPSWTAKFKVLLEEERNDIILDECYPADGAVTMGEVICLLNRLTKEQAIIISDVGQHQMITCRYARFRRTRSNITSGGLGTMGFALPAAIGAKTAVREREVIAIIGDGGFQMTLQELGTVMQSGLKIRIVILNNQRLGMVRQWQELFHGERYSSVEIASPNYTMLAQAYSIAGRKVETREQLEPAIMEMLNHPEAFLLEVAIAEATKVFPMIPQGANVSQIRSK